MHLRTQFQKKKDNNRFHFHSINNFNHVFSVVVQLYCIMIVFLDSSACFFICYLSAVCFSPSVCSSTPEQNWSHLVCHVCFHFWQIRERSLRVIRWEWSNRLWNVMYTETERKANNDLHKQNRRKMKVSMTVWNIFSGVVNTHLCPGNEKQNIMWS